MLGQSKTGALDIVRKTIKENILLYHNSLCRLGSQRQDIAQHHVVEIQLSVMLI